MRASRRDALQGGLPQPIPFRMVGGPQVSRKVELTMDAGLQLEMTGKTFTVFNSNLLIEGTAADPVVFTGGAGSPPPARPSGAGTHSAMLGTPR